MALQALGNGVAYFKSAKQGHQAPGSQAESRELIESLAHKTNVCVQEEGGSDVVTGGIN